MTINKNLRACRWPLGDSRKYRGRATFGLVHLTQTPPLLVRRRTAADDPFIARLAKRAFQEYSARAAEETLGMARSGTAWLACRGDERLGFVVARADGPFVAELCAIAVDEPARGQGVGAALLERAERALAAAGVRELTLHTAEANLSALELFLKQGFRIERRLPRFYRGVFDACAMRKRVRSARG